MKRWRRPSVCHRGIAAACEAVLCSLWLTCQHLRGEATVSSIFMKGSRNQKISSEQSGIALKAQTVNPNAVGDTSGTDRLFAAAEYDP